MAPVAHAGHWLPTLIFWVGPVMMIGLVLLIQRRRPSRGARLSMRVARTSLDPDGPHTGSVPGPALSSDVRGTAEEQGRCFGHPVSDARAGVRDRGRFLGRG